MENDEDDLEEFEEEVEIVVGAQTKTKFVQITSGVLVDRRDMKEARRLIRDMVTLLQDSIPEASMNEAASDLVLGADGKLYPASKKRKPKTDDNAA